MKTAISMLAMRKEFWYDDISVVAGLIWLMFSLFRTSNIYVSFLLKIGLPPENYTTANLAFKRLTSVSKKTISLAKYVNVTVTQLQFSNSYTN